MYMFSVPIALLNFNRPHCTNRVFEIIRKLKPMHLLLVVDGPRTTHPNDYQLCAQVKDILNKVDWECKVDKNYSDINLGSFRRNATALKWIFEKVEEVIIIEDDCIPSASFFPFCQELLEKYRYVENIGVITGLNSGFYPKSCVNTSYYFSAYSFYWGWASWRRVWEKVDLSMSWWQGDNAPQLLASKMPNCAGYDFFNDLCYKISTGKLSNGWDYQFCISMFLTGKLGIIPSVNLIQNIGFDFDGTNCTDPNHDLAKLVSNDLKFPLLHPTTIQRNQLLDAYIQQIHFTKPSFFTRIYRYSKKIIAKF